MLDFRYFKLSISIGDNLFEISNLEVIAEHCFMCSVSLKEFEDELRFFSQLRVTMNNERVSSRQVLFFGFYFFPLHYFLIVGGFSAYMKTKCYSSPKEIMQLQLVLCTLMLYFNF